MARSLLDKLLRENSFPTYRILDRIDLPGFAAIVVGPKRGARPPLEVFEIHLTPSGEGSGSFPVADAPGALEAAVAAARRWWPKVKVDRPRAAAPARRAAPALTEAAAAAPFARLVALGKPPTARPGDLARLVRKVGRLPAGYQTFVTRLGEGLLDGRVRVYGPARILRDLSAWRARIRLYWFWGDAPLDQATALECVPIADTIVGDELVFHPSDPDTLWLLPRNGTRARRLGRGFGAALRRLVKKPAAQLAPMRPPARSKR